MRLQEYLTEGDDFFNKTVKKLKKMTNDNDHTNALALGLELIGLDPEAKRARALSIKVDKAGGYSPGDPLAKEKDKLYRLMMTTAKRELKNSDFIRFYGAF